MRSWGSPQKKTSHGICTEDIPLLSHLCLISKRQLLWNFCLEHFDLSPTLSYYNNWRAFLKMTSSTIFIHALYFRPFLIINICSSVLLFWRVLNNTKKTADTIYKLSPTYNIVKHEKILKDSHKTFWFPRFQTPNIRTKIESYKTTSGIFPPPSRAFESDFSRLYLRAWKVIWNSPRGIFFSSFGLSPLVPMRCSWKWKIHHVRGRERGREETNSTHDDAVRCTLHHGKFPDVRKMRSQSFSHFSVYISTKICPLTHSNATFQSFRDIFHGAVEVFFTRKSIEKRQKQQQNAKNIFWLKIKKMPRRKKFRAHGKIEIVIGRWMKFFIHQLHHKSQLMMWKEFFLSPRWIFSPSFTFNQLWICEKCRVANV